MNLLAFLVIAFMLAIYVLLDGYDLGVGAALPFVARTEERRREALAAIGPFWNGNEVWLIAAGGALFALFPQAYASAFSGFYLPFMVVLWLLMGRGVAMELRNHFPSAIWRQFWDAVFALSSALLIVLLGVALGNLIRGVPLDANGYFSGTFAFLLNPFALCVGALALAVLTLHGVAFLRWRLAGTRRWFVLSSSAVVALMVAAWLSIFPYLVPAFPRGSGGISIYDAAPSPVALGSALTVTIVGLVAVVIYAIAVWRKVVHASTGSP